MSAFGHRDNFPEPFHGLIFHRRLNHHMLAGIQCCQHHLPVDMTGRTDTQNVQVRIRKQVRVMRGCLAYIQFPSRVLQPLLVHITDHSAFGLLKVFVG